MASLNTQTFGALLQSWVAAVQSTAAGLVDFAIGSILRAMGEADSLVVLWLQGLILQLLATTRAQTSAGSDLDSFIAQFAGTPPNADFARLPAVAASGNLTFARVTTTQQATVPVGSTAQTQDGTQNFQVTLDTSNAAYNAGLNAYVLAAGVTSVTAPAKALAAGSAGNVVAGSITVITATSGLPGIDTVTNASPFAGGVDAELDPPLRLRFVNWFLSLASGTPLAIEDAIANIQQGATCILVENATYSGSTLYGYGYVVVDDGSAAPGSSFLSACQAAVGGVRGFTTRCDVFAINKVVANWAMTIKVKSGFVGATVAANVQTAVNAMITALGQGMNLEIAAMVQAAMNTAGVANVTLSSVQINSAATDLACTSQQRIMPGTGTVTPS